MRDPSFAGLLRQAMRGKPRVPATDGFVPVLFEVPEEVENEWRIQVVDDDIAGALVQTLMCKGQQQPEAVAVGCHSASACVPLLLQTLRKELLHKDGKGLCGGMSHDAPP